MALNILILAGPIALAIYYPHVGDLASMTGAVGGAFTIYLIPISVYVAYKLKAIKDESSNSEDFAKMDTADRTTGLWQGNSNDDEFHSL